MTTQRAKPPSASNGPYLWLLTWSFALFNSLRVAAYLPTIWVVYQSGDSSQHSLWTSLTWFGANLTTAEQPVIEKILTHLGLQARAPPRAPARRSQLQAA